MPKQGFQNQWVQICRVGDFVDASGKRVKITDKFLNDVIANFDSAEHEAPICIGHPALDAPAYGWTTELRRNGDLLEAKFADTNDDFERMVERGEFRKRSSAFYVEPPVLKHVGFLGAKPPAIKGLRNIQFADGDTVTVEILLNEENKKMEKEDVNQVADGLWERIKNSFKSESAPVVVPPATPPATVGLSEADVKAIVEKAVAAAKTEAKQEAVAEFAEQIKTLTETVNSSTASGRRAEIVQFVESIPAESGKHYLKRAGAVEFLESLAVADEADAGKPAINFSEGEGASKVEHQFSRLEWAKDFFRALPPFIQFGERFGNLKASAVADIPVDENSLNTMRGEMGIKTAGGAK